MNIDKVFPLKIASIWRWLKNKYDHSEVTLSLYHVFEGRCVDKHACSLEMQEMAVAGILSRTKNGVLPFQELRVSGSMWREWTAMFLGSD